MRLLSINQDTKTRKGMKHGYMTGVMYLAPHTMGTEYNVCPMSTPGCRESCLFTAGRGAFPNVWEARRNRTKLYQYDRHKFWEQLEHEIRLLIARAHRAKLEPCVRLNGTSDLPLLAQTMAPLFPDVMFYDYTKIPRPWERERDNYRLTFSRSESNHAECEAALTNGINVCVVANKIHSPLFSLDYRWIDGDETDLRFLDPRPAIVLVKPKGKARKDKTGFVLR